MIINETVIHALHTLFYFVFFLFNVQTQSHQFAVYLFGPNKWGTEEEENKKTIVNFFFLRFLIVCLLPKYIK